MALETIAVAMCLRRAGGYLRRGWTHGTHALDAAGRDCSPTAPEAAAWDARGAIRADSALDDAALRRLWALLERELGDPEAVICAWQDRQRSAEDVAALLERVAAGEETACPPSPPAEELAELQRRKAAIQAEMAGRKARLAEIERRPRRGLDGFLAKPRDRELFGLGPPAAAREPAEA